MKKILFTVLFVILTVGSNFAQSVDISGQIRPRFEMNNKDFNSDTKASTFTGVRSRLNVLIKKNKNLEAFFQFQDTRTWGTEPSTLSSTSNVDIHQAYFILKNFAGWNMDVKVGRMEAIYGPERIIGAVGWSNVARSFDGALLKFKGKNFDLDFFGYQVVENLELGDKSDSYFSGLYGNIKSIKSYSIQPFVLFNRNVGTDLSMFTLGFYTKGNLKAFKHELEFAYQTGEIGTNNISALMAAFNFNYTFKAKVKPMLGAGIDYLSGDDGTDSDLNVFNTLYATNHKYYGYMDYFTNIPAHTMGLGLVDIHGTFALNPAKKLKLKADFHQFNSAEDLYLNNGSTSSNFGSELDITAILTYSKDVKFQAGYSFFTPGDIFKQVKNKDTSTWFYFMTVVNF